MGALTPAPLMLLWGEDSFAIKAAEDSLIARVVDPGFASMNLNILEGPATAPSQAVSAAATMPFGPGGRLVLVRDCPYFSAGKFEGADEVEVLEEIAAKGLPPGCHLVFSVHKNIDKRLAQTKAILGKAAVIEFPALKPWEDRAIVDWLMEQARGRGIKLGTDLAQELVASLGTDRWQLGNELSKLETYANGEPITHEMVRILAAPGESDVFGVLESISRRRPLEAVAQLRKMLVSEAALKILATMATMMRGWLHVKLLAEQGMNADAIAKAQGAKSTFKIKKDLESARSWTSYQLQEALSLLLEADTALKTSSGKSNEALHLESLIVRLAML